MPQISAETKGLKVHHRGEWIGWVIFGLAAFFYCYEYFLRIAPPVMGEQIRAAFHLDATGFGVLLAFYYYAYDPLQLPVGVMMDRFGPRRLLFVACLMCVLGLYFFSNTTNQLSIAQLGRFLVGFGSAFAFVGVLKIASVWLPTRYFAVVAGVTTSLGMIGAMLGQMALPIWLEHTDWHTTIWQSAFVGIVLAFVILLVVRDHRSAAKPFPHQQVNVKGLIVDFVKLLKNKDVWINGGIGCLMFLSLTVVAEAWGIEFLKVAHGFDLKSATWANAMVFLGFAIGGPIVGWISEKCQSRRIPMICGSTLACIVLVPLIFIANLPHPIVYALLFLLGLVSSPQVLIFVVASEIFPKVMTGTALALTNMICMVGGALFQPLTGKLLDIHWAKTLLMENDLRVYSVSDFQFAMSMVLICYIVNVVLCWLLRESYQGE